MLCVSPCCLSSRVWNVECGAKTESRTRVRYSDSESQHDYDDTHDVSNLDS